jgi:hypothetical protein
MVNSLPHYPVAKADAQTFPSSVILSETEVPAALAAGIEQLEGRGSAHPGPAEEPSEMKQTRAPNRISHSMNVLRPTVRGK